MAKQSLSLLHIIRTMTGAYREDSRSDAELLSRYAESHNETAFATLMVRHGPLVWGICSHVLGNTQDVEDACQIVFLTLANKAGEIRVTKTLAGWLQQVTRRAARDVRKTVRSRKKLQEQLKTMAGMEAVEEEPPNEAHELLHDELAKLPEKLRTALVLHYLEGKTQAEVADILGVKESSVWHRLARGKARLQERLTKRGLTLGAATLAAMLESASSQAVIPAALVSKTVQTVAAFRDGKLAGGLAKLGNELLKHAPSTTPWWKAGWMIALVCVSGLGAGVGGIVWKVCFGSKAEPALASVAAQEAPQRPDKAIPSPVRLDAYGDPLPPGALVRIGTVRFRPAEEDGIPSSTRADVAFGPDGKTIFSTHKVGNKKGSMIHVWETATGKEIRQIKATTGELRIVVSPGQKQLTALGHRGGLWSWDLQGQEPRLRWKIKIKGDWQSLAASSDGRMLACCCPQYISLRDAATGKEIRRINWDGKGYLNKLVFSPDGAMLASSGDAYAGNQFVWLWDPGRPAEME